MTSFAARARALHKMRFLRFGFIGGCGFLVDASALWLILHLFEFANLDSRLTYLRVVARVMSFIVAATFTWFGNRTLTFPDRAVPTGLRREWATFVIANAPGGFVNVGVYSLILAFAPPPVNQIRVAFVAGVLAGLVLNFTLSSRVVFRHKP
jgi:putative flippase GtrA